MGLPAKLMVVGVVPNHVSIADRRAPYGLQDVAGFDSAVPHDGGIRRGSAVWGLPGLWPGHAPL